MGLMLCDIHGENGLLPNVSLKIAQEVNKKEMSSISKIFVIDMFIQDDNELILIEEYYVSEDEFIRRGLKKSYVITDEQSENDFSGKMPETNCVCQGCFNDYIKDNDIEIQK